MSDYFFKSAVISKRRAKMNKKSQKYSNKQKLEKIGETICENADSMFWNCFCIW